MGGGGIGRPDTHARLTAIENINVSSAVRYVVLKMEEKQVPLRYKNL